MNDIPRDPLIRDLSIVLAGALHPSAVIGPGPRLAARRMRDVLGLEDGAARKEIEARLREVLAGSAAPTTDPAAPAWLLDVVHDVHSFRQQRLIDMMLERDEDVTDSVLWKHRRSQLESLLASGKAERNVKA